jgi:hypothetical protein
MLEEQKIMIESTIEDVELIRNMEEANKVAKSLRIDPDALAELTDELAELKEEQNERSEFFENYANEDNGELEELEKIEAEIREKEMGLKPVPVHPIKPAPVPEPQVVDEELERELARLMEPAM